MPGSFDHMAWEPRITAHCQGWDDNWGKVKARKTRVYARKGYDGGYMVLDMETGKSKWYKHCQAFAIEQGIPKGTVTTAVIHNSVIRKRWRISYASANVE